MKVESNFPVAYLKRHFQTVHSRQISNWTAGEHLRSSPQDLPLGEQLDCEAAEGSNTTSKCDKSPNNSVPATYGPEQTTAPSSGSTDKLGDGTSRHCQIFKTSNVTMAVPLISWVCATVECTDHTFVRMVSPPCPVLRLHFSSFFFWYSGVVKLQSYVKGLLQTQPSALLKCPLHFK